MAITPLVGIPVTLDTASAILFCVSFSLISFNLEPILYLPPRIIPGTLNIAPIFNICFSKPSVTFDIEDLKYSSGLSMKSPKDNFLSPLDAILWNPLINFSLKVLVSSSSSLKPRVPPTFSYT